MFDLHKYVHKIWSWMQRFCGRHQVIKVFVATG